MREVSVHHNAIKVQPPVLTTAQKVLPGIFVTLGLAFLARWLGALAPIVGGPIFAIVLGMVARAVMGLDPILSQGTTFASKKVLQASIVLLGGSLSLGQVWKTGVDSLGVMLVSLGVGLVTAILMGKVLRVPWRLGSLIGVGTSICGASAIAAVAPVIQADEDEVAYGISTVFLFNLIAVFVFPLLGRVTGLDDWAFGLWAGTAINDTSSVVAAGYSWSQQAGTYATIVKLARTSMIVPVALGFALWSTRNSLKTIAEVKIGKIIPWFIVWFLVASVLNSFGLLGNALPDALSSMGKFGITMALAAVGLGVDFRKMRATGFKPVVLGLITWATVAVISLAQIRW